MRGRLPSGLRRSKNVTLLSKGREWFEGRCDSIRALPYSKMAKDMGEPRGGPSNTILRLRTRRALKTRRQKVLPKRPFKREFTLVCESTYCALTHTGSRGKRRRLKLNASRSTSAMRKCCVSTAQFYSLWLLQSTKIQANQRIRYYREGKSRCCTQRHSVGPSPKPGRGNVVTSCSCSGTWTNELESMRTAMQQSTGPLSGTCVSAVSDGSTADRQPSRFCRRAYDLFRRSLAGLSSDCGVSRTVRALVLAHRDISLAADNRGRRFPR